jgi:hypothetical protein
MLPTFPITIGGGGGCDVERIGGPPLLLVIEKTLSLLRPNLSPGESFMKRFIGIVDLAEEEVGGVVDFGLLAEPWLATAAIDAAMLSADDFTVVG